MFYEVGGEGIEVRAFGGMDEEIIAVIVKPGQGSVMVEDFIEQKLKEVATY